ncbi:sensor histidine kinase [Roseateles oligotrophus]|uniref:histidine kinase n=1 Tax=Roseateles oligotrophus TaxID=1769250 RepID=A0ABT2YIA9_9BURK|nr:ATP-binding protein [Roseateles oligotrophus]MCV2369795.1 sensor histidine kinase [Roseateles oligotrophus]
MNKALHRLWQPTLTRRVILTLLLTAGLAWLVLLTYYYQRETSPQSVDAYQRERTQALAAALAKIEQPEQALVAAAFAADLLNSRHRQAGRPHPVLLQLEDSQGRRLYRSAEAGATGGAVLAGEPGRFVDLSLNGVLYHVLRIDSGRWRLLIGEVRADDSWLLGRLSSDLAMSVLISFPFVLLPTWFAVARGLSPLRKLSRSIGARGPDDLGPLGFVARYAELAPVADALDRLLAQLRSKIAREHGFVQDAAHELRTPMAVISAQAHVLACADGADERRLAAQQLEQAVARASRLIQQLLEMARIDAAGPAKPSLIDVAQLLRQELAEAAPLAISRDIDLSLEAPDSLLHELEETALRSVLQNLLGNALRYVQPGGQVVVELAAQQGRLSLSVADDGPGIAEAEQGLVFERFYRVAGSEVAGSGLGLAIVTQAVARLHGKLRLDAGLGGRGCRFLVELPGKD